MNGSDERLGDARFLRRAVDAAIHIGVLVVLVLWCFQIVRPFVVPIVWGMIIAVAAFPGFRRLQSLLGGRAGIAAVLFTLLGLALLIAPTVMLTGTLVEGAQRLASGLYQGTLRIPPPPQSVGAWPLIGEPLQNFWTLASDNLEAALQQLAPQLKTVGTWLLSSAAGTGLAILQFIIAIIIAAVMMAKASGGQDVAYAIGQRLAGAKGVEFANLAGKTVRSVAGGILGVALLQSLLAGLGFLAVGIPGAGLWALLALMLSVVQIGVFPVVLPSVIYVFFTAEPLTAVLFLVWSIFVGVIDNVLKPLLLGRGVKVPMLVIFIGAIGGFLTSGIIGLFVGSVVLVLGYTLLLAWLYEGPPPAADSSS